MSKRGRRRGEEWGSIKGGGERAGFGKGTFTYDVRTERANKQTIVPIGCVSGTVTGGGGPKNLSYVNGLFGKKERKKKRREAAAEHKRRKSITEQQRRLRRLQW